MPLTLFQSSCDNGYSSHEVYDDYNSYNDYPSDNEHIHDSG